MPFYTTSEPISEHLQRGAVMAVAFGAANWFMLGAPTPQMALFSGAVATVGSHLYDGLVTNGFLGVGGGVE